MQTATLPDVSLVAPEDIDSLRRLSVTGWLFTHDSARLLAPTFGFDPDLTRSRVADRLAGSISDQIGGTIVGPRDLTVADRLALAGFVFRDTGRRLPAQAIAVWLAMPRQVDWAMRLYYGAWHSYLTSQALTGWLPWQQNGVLPVMALRRARERLMQDSVGALTRLELIEFLKHLDALAAEW